MMLDIVECVKEIQIVFGNLKVVVVEKRKLDCGGLKVSGK